VVLQLTRPEVAVRWLADTAAVEMGETAASGTGGSEVDADVVQVSAPPDIGSVVHPAPSYDQHLDWHCRVPLSSPAKPLLATGKVGDIQTELLAEHRQRNSGWVMTHERTM
jgi:hypothetical protein